MRARINDQALERELGRLSDGSDLPPTAVAERRTGAGSGATPASTHVEAELIRLACADTNGLARRWRVVFGHRGPSSRRTLIAARAGSLPPRIFSPDGSRMIVVMP